MEKAAFLSLSIALFCSQMAQYTQLKEMLKYSEQECEYTDNHPESSPVYRDIFFTGLGIGISVLLIILTIIDIIR